MQEPTEQESISDNMRATELQHGTVPVEMVNAIAKLQVKENDVDDKSNVAARSWTLAEYASQPQLLGTFNSSSLPFIFVNKWSNVRNYLPKAMRNFLFTSWTVNLRFEVNSVFQEQGMDIVYVHNVPQPALQQLLGGKAFTDGGSEMDPTIWFLLPHRKIMLGENSDITVQLRWVSPFKSAFDQNSFNEDGDSDYEMNTCIYKNWIPVQTATGVTPMRTVRVWLWLSDLKYSGYLPNNNDNF